ncbi:discoidin domain-containing receptor tyrosine kinase B-like [Cylas formicarius]|uniref:discoidin domain-containing receptor tyrosine kinase B-like n=1 Tax=Cylas formicarius TaxID=197179 RepID=UPI00295892D8|nr:discoidin domain-containing receptor tyrosine kinase B-like [Cylas formicarius]XP_060535441.1 discoidin domain-containing receptor tyrosine kinase B-like [Cylas formicarius]
MKEFLAILCLTFVGAARSVEPSQCIAPLGMESLAIKDEDITASSSFDHGNVGPHHGRVRNEINGGAWCPQTMATPDSKEWLEINLHTVHMITSTETQGRFGNGNGVEFAESYMLEYWRPRFNKWVRYRSKTNGELLKGNINTYLEYKTQLDPPIWASKIRFIPYSSHKRTVCMRVELYGCRWSDGIVSYSMPQGDKRGNWEFYDLAYDGHWDGEKLKYGLGQLTDGQIGPEDFKLAFHQENSQGWVGWKNDSREGKPIEIIFEFDKIREFSAVHIYTNNQFTREVQVFAEAKVMFSVGGKRYKGEPITFDYMEDCIFETPRNVSIKLHHRVGRFVKLQMHFAARWILLSEVTFDSLPVSGNFTEEEEIEEPVFQKDQVPLGTDNKNVISAVNPSGGMGQYLGIIVGVLAVLVVFMIAIVLYIVIQQRRYKSSPRPSQVPGGCDKAALYREPSLGRLTSSSDYADVRDPEYAVPLQPPQTPRTPPTLQNFFPKPPSVPPPPEKYYAATEICGGGFVPPPPPLSTPPPVRLGRQPRYVANARTYVGP